MFYKKINQKVLKTMLFVKIAPTLNEITTALFVMFFVLNQRNKGRQCNENTDRN